MLEKELCIFVASADKNVIKYINIITHAVKFFDIKNIIFIKLVNNDTLEDFDLSKYVRTNINDKLRALSDEYPFYEDVFKVFSNSKEDRDLDYVLLKDYIKEHKTNNTFYDLTSLPKVLCMSIFMKLISCRVENIFNFEILDFSARDKTYDKLSKTDFRVVRLVDQDSFTNIVNEYTKKQNKDKLCVVVFSTVFSLVLMFIFKNNIVWIGTLFTILSGILPILELAGIFNIKKKLDGLFNNAKNKEIS